MSIDTNSFVDQFQVYNIVLRQSPIDAYERQRNEYHNMYTTTICVLNSALLSIAHETKFAPGRKLYRGLGGCIAYPSNFFEHDQMGNRGIMEWGFLSTTTNKSIAVDYSGARQSRPFPCIVEIESSSVNRGADISNFNQYPGEHSKCAPTQFRFSD